MDPRTSPVVVVLFTLEGCPACEEYKPRFAKIAKMYQQYVPVILADANDPKFADLAERLKVEAVPATFMLRRPRGMIRMVGGVPDHQIHWLLSTAVRTAQTH